MVLDDLVITTEAPTATGTTTIDSAAYDMGKFSGITFIVRLGTPAANNNIRGRQDVATGGAYADLKDTAVTHATNNQLMLSIIRPQKQFVKCRIARGTSTTIDSLVVIQWGGRGVRPVTQATSTVEEYTTPIEGTA